MAMIPYMAAGYAADRLMGGSGMTGLALGTGVGGFSTGAFSNLFASAIPEAATINTAATTAASNTMPLVMSNSATMGGSGLGTVLGSGGNTMLGSAGSGGLMSGNMANFGSVNPLTTGAINESISPFTPFGKPIGGATNIFGTEISNQAVNSALTGGKAFGGLFENTPLDYVSQGTDFINEGWEDMSLADKGSTLMMGNQALDTMTAPQAMIQPPQQREVIGKEPNIAAPLAINVPASGVNIRTTGQLERMLTPQQRKALGLL